MYTFLQAKDNEDRIYLDYLSYPTRTILVYKKMETQTDILSAMILLYTYPSALFFPIIYF